MPRRSDSSNSTVVSTYIAGVLVVVWIGMGMRRPSERHRERKQT